MSDTHLATLCQQMKETVYCRGQPVFVENIDYYEHLYMVSKGEFKSFKVVNHSTTN